MKKKDVIFEEVIKEVIKLEKEMKIEFNIIAFFNEVRKIEEERSL